MLNGPFADNTTAEIVQPVNGVDTVVGYMFASPGGEVASQEQRWVLWPNFVPMNRVRTTLRAPGKLLYFRSLAAWQGMILKSDTNPLWRPGSTYVKVNTASYSSIAGQTPPPVPSLVAADGTENAKLSDKRLQIDDGPANMRQNNTTVGWVYGTLIAGAAGSILKTNVERWVLAPGYQQYGNIGGSTVVIEQSNLTVTTADGFVAYAQNAWTEGSTYLLSTCAYLASVPKNP